MTEDMSALEERLTPVILDDYKEVAKIIEDAGKRYKVDQWAIHGCKPWTILNLIISSELGVPKDKRAACAAVVDVGFRAVAISDDIMDKDLPITYDTIWSVLDCTRVMEFLLFEQKLAGLLSSESYEQMQQVVTVQSRRMWDAIKWRNKEGNLDNRSAAFETFLEKYLDPVCSGLFYWSILPIGVYHGPAQKRISDVAPAINSFARIFQMKDDVGDILHDYHEGQLTSALFFVRDNPEEFERLKEETSKPERKLSAEEFQTLFPKSYEIINGWINSEEEAAISTLSAANVSPEQYQILGLLCNNQVYRRMRAVVDKELYPTTPELPKDYTPEQRVRISHIIKKRNRVFENAAPAVILVAGAIHERSEHRRMYNPE